MTSSTAVRRAWLIGGSVLTVLALALSTATVVGRLARETERVVRTFPAAEVERLDLRTANGAVEVLGSDVDEIEVVAEVDHGLRRTTTSADVHGGALEVRSSCPLLGRWCRTRYRVTVPRELAVAVESSNGRLDVRDLDGDVRARSRNGPMELTRVGGDLDLSTANGGLSATALRSDRVVAATSNGQIVLAFVDPPTDVGADSRNGRVDIAVPEGEVAYRVDLESRRGGTDSDVRTDPVSDRSIVARTDNGSVTVRYAAG
jgi:hypothetical protein